ncbi:MAG: hypothetical protein HZA54_01745 [Planctomycetes bacterium]|nr:hypothetical protein [Planctomycetota bacterium]
MPGAGPKLCFEIWVDAREQPQKCTVAPLRGRPDVILHRYHVEEPIRLEARWLLHPDGVPLDRFARSAEAVACTRLGVIDTTWRRVEGVLRRIVAPAPPARLAIPPGFVTAYPRRSKIVEDPEAGLASVEAIFLAAALLGHYDETLLEHYHWRAEFLARNRERLAAIGG